MTTHDILDWNTFRNVICSITGMLNTAGQLDYGFMMRALSDAHDLDRADISKVVAKMERSKLLVVSSAGPAHTVTVVITGKGRRMVQEIKRCFPPAA